MSLGLAAVWKQIFAFLFAVNTFVNWVHAMAQLVEALRYKPEGSGFDFRWCHWIFYLT
jgi:hypothetical protein